MQKVLGQDIKDLEERKNFLIDNADGVEEMDYHKSYESEEKIRLLISRRKSTRNSSLSRRKSRTYVKTSSRRVAPFTRKSIVSSMKTRKWLASTTPRECLFPHVQHIVTNYRKQFSQTCEKKVLTIKIQKHESRET